MSNAIPDVLAIYTASGHTSMNMSKDKYVGNKRKVFFPNCGFANFYDRFELVEIKKYLLDFSILNTLPYRAVMTVGDDFCLSLLVLGIIPNEGHDERILNIKP